MNSIRVRVADVDDIPAIVDMLADDPLGATRENPGDLSAYRAAFEAIDTDHNQYLVVAVDDSGVVGTAQLSIVPGLSRNGMSRAMIEGVRVRRDRRSDGVGAILMEWAADMARTRGCRLIQLTSDKTRTDAHRFYSRLGYVDSHIGYKRPL